MSDTIHADVAIVGAGISGLALAIRLGRLGWDVCLVDKAAPPRDKVCGEGIMPLGLRCLAALGIDLHQLPGSDFDGLEYLVAAEPGNHRNSEIRHRLRFPPGTMGRGVRRTRLVELLQDAALKQPGVHIARDEIRGVEWERGSVAALRGNQAEYRARLFVAADGVHSRLAAWCGAKPIAYGERMALRRHYRPVPGALPPRVQVGLLGQYDLYLTPVGNGELLATTLTDRTGYRAIAHDYDRFLQDGPYGSIFTGAAPVSGTLAWHHPLFQVKRPVAGGVWCVGDASGGIDPCLGMGMSLGLHQAAFAGDQIASTLSGTTERTRAEAAYARKRAHLFHHYHHFGRVFRALVGSARGARALVWAMGCVPGIADRLLAVVADMRPWVSLLGRVPAGPHPLDRRVASQGNGRAAMRLP
jgi:2-polyprenyl-6-methoxyphenol hydroxylase-like FAD-dependent oxidoreductase